MLQDDAFLNNASNATSVEELTNLFNENGATLTNEQVLAFLNACENEETEGELSVVALDAVVGGKGVGVVTLIKKCIDGFKKGWSWGNKFYEWEQKYLR